MNSELWKKLYPNFKKSEFKCPCGCCLEPPIDEKLMNILQALRNKYGSITVTSGYRCKKYNSTVKNAVANSDHQYFLAADVKFEGSNKAEKRTEAINYAKDFVGFKYGYHATAIYKNGKWSSCNYPNMGSAIHISVEE